MKVLPFSIPKPANVTLYVEQYKGTTFYEKLHQHKEIQVSLISAGEGTYIIGDCVGEFATNDIFVIGENLPHILNVMLFAKENAKCIPYFFRSMRLENIFSIYQNLNIFKVFLTVPI